MDQQLIPFIMHHGLLVGVFVVLLLLFLWGEVQRSGKAVSPQGLTALVNSADALVLDVRDASEFKLGHITGSLNIPYAKLAERMDELKKTPERPIVVVCKMGQVAGAATLQLKVAGLSRVFKLDGGISNWKASSLPLVKS